MSSYMFGVWPGAMDITHINYSTSFGGVFAGSFISYDPYVTYGSYDYQLWYNMTYNLGTYDVQSYLDTYGATYTATYYRDVYPNVRAIQWV